MNTLLPFKHSLLALLVSSTAIAAEQTPQTNNEKATLEVIQVTSQKRPQSLQEVPVSITTLNGSKLADAGISQMEEMSDYVPNFTVTKSGQGFNIYMRGLGSGPNQGFEQTVGTYVDGIYRGRAVLMRSAFLDIDMIEVLRGPQSTLFGMNTTGGALNITSKNATDDFEAGVKGYYSPTFNKQDLEAFVSGGLSDTFRARAAVKFETDDGHLDNVITGDSEPARESIASRLTLDWDITEHFNANLKLQHDTDEITGRNVVVSVEPYLLNNQNDPKIAALLDRLVEYKLDTNTANTNPALGEIQREDSTANHATLNLNYEFDEHTLTAITGWQSYELTGTKDQDNTPSSLIYSPHFEESYDQLSQEIRFMSTGERDFNYIVGVYLQQSELEYQETSIVYPLSIRGERQFKSDSDLWAIFTQLDYKFNDSLSASLGLRYTKEQKEGRRTMAIIDPTTGDALANSALITPPALAPLFNALNVPGLPGPVYQQMLGTQLPYLDPLLGQPNGTNFVNPVFGTIDQHNLNDKRTENSFTPALTVSYQHNQDAMYYAKVATGFKAGGFDARSNLSGNFEFNEEQVVSYELGSKLTLDEGAAMLNIALFQMNFDDLQTSVFDGQVGFNVTNAGEATTLGLELDSRWLVSEGITLFGGLGLLDFNWDDFKGAKCFTSNVTVSDNIDESGKACDLTGQTNALVPKYTANLGIEHISYALENYVITSQLDVNYKSSFYTATDLNPYTEQESYAKLNLRVALSDEENWQLALIGKNITNELTSNFSFDLPFTRGAYANFVEPGRSWGLQFSYDFW